MADLPVPLSTKLSGENEEMVKRRVQAKLESFLPSATDSVLCDYVLVMVGNKKTSNQIANDLEAFLGQEESEAFAKWLWELLTAVEKKTALPTEEAAPSKAATKEAPRSKSRSESRSRSRSKSRSRSRSRDRRSRSRSRSRSRDRSRPRDRKDIYSATVAQYSQSRRDRSRSRSRDRHVDRRREDDRRRGYVSRADRDRERDRERDRGLSRRDGDRDLRGDLRGSLQDSRSRTSRGDKGGGGGAGRKEDRRGVRQPISSRLLMSAVTTASKQAESVAGKLRSDTAYMGDTSMQDGEQELVSEDEEEAVPVAGGGMRSEAAWSKPAQRVDQEEEEEGGGEEEEEKTAAQRPKAGARQHKGPAMDRVGGGAGAGKGGKGGGGDGEGNGGGDLRSILRKKRGAGRMSKESEEGERKAAAKPEEKKAQATEKPQKIVEEAKEGEDAQEGAAAADGDDEIEVEFSVTLPKDVMASAAWEDDEGYGGEEEVGAEGGADYDPSAGYRGRGRGGFRGRGRGLIRGRGGIRGRGRGTFAPRGRGVVSPRGRGRGRGASAAEPFAAKKWVNPALLKTADGTTSASAETPATDKKTASTVTGLATGAKPVAATGVKPSAKKARAAAPVIGVLNLDGDLSGADARGLYKPAKWVKPGLQSPTAAKT